LTPLVPRLRIDLPIWLSRERNVFRERFPSLTRDLQADIAVIGGGVTGAAVAWRFAEAGVNVVLVEGRRIGRGSTAASTALLMQEPDEDFTALAQRYGRARALRIWELSRESTHEFAATLDRLDISCDLQPRDSVYYATTARHALELRSEHRMRVRAGLRAVWLEGAALRRTIGFDATAAIRTRGNAQVDPYRACIGLMRAAAGTGARVFERSPVTSIRPSTRDVVVRCARGTVRASRVIIATGYATPYFKPLGARFRMLTTYVVATRRLTLAERRRTGLNDVMLWDMERPYHYARWTPDRRLIFGGADRPLMPERQRRKALEEGTRAVHADLVRLYPALADVPLEYAWEGLFATTPDGLPYIGPHRRYARQLFALGYGGNGMTFGFLASRLLLEWYRGNRTKDHDLFAFSR
jgi:glycine/D-amino acid oxidase-like deaminating enzyme